MLLIMCTVPVTWISRSLVPTEDIVTKFLNNNNSNDDDGGDDDGGADGIGVGG